MSETLSGNTQEEEKHSKVEKQEFKKPTNLLVLNKKSKKSHGDHKSKHSSTPAEHISQHSLPLPYKEPEWGGLSEGNYTFDVLKCGKIIDNLVVKSKSFYIFGRQGNCDFPMLNPTISRYHAIFQFRKDPSTDQPAGFYLYDLGSTHGTFLNKKKIPPNTYVRMRVGHLLKLGLSTRYFILNGPEEDMDIEYDNIRRFKQPIDDEDDAENQKGGDEKYQKKEEGIDWGMGEDADEETDLTENPYAATNNEELYLNDPKKTLRGWFEREGYDLEYNIEEKGAGTFACSIELPIDVSGIKRAEALVKGKKNHAKVQCALEACRLLDRYGLLRVSHHVSLKAKPKKWEDDDFYDSDEDSFLDRTGTIELKRQQRMKAAGKLEDKVETYSSLVEKHKNIIQEIDRLENELTALTKSKNDSKEEDEKDELDAFMDDLHYSVGDKSTIKKIKDKLIELKKERKMCQHMMTLSKPAELPSLNTKEDEPNQNATKIKSKTPLFGPRKNLLRKKNEKNEVNIENPEEKQDKLENIKEILKETKENSKPSKDQRTENIDNNSSNDDLENEVENNDDEEAKEEEIENYKDIHKENENENNEIINTIEENTNKEKTSEEESFLEESCSSNPSKNESSEKETNNTDEVNMDIDLHSKVKDRKRKSSRTFKENKITKYEDPPEYTDWLPPNDQTGDGKTSLNDKFGY